MNVTSSVIYRNCRLLRFNQKSVCARFSATLCRKQTRTLRQSFQQVFKRYESVQNKLPKKSGKRTSYEINRLFSLAKPEKWKLTGELEIR